MSVDLKNGELLGLIPKPVPLVEKVGRAICDAVIGGQVVRGLVVLEDAGSNSGIDNTADVEFRGGFQDNSFENEEGPEGRGQGNVFGFSCGACDNALQLCEPIKGAAGQLNNKPSTRSCRVGVGVIFGGVETDKFGIDK